MIYKEKLYEQLKNNIEPDCEYFYLCEIEEKAKKYDELIDCLKDLVKNRHTNSKVVWFDSEYAKTYGELCSMAGAGDTRLALLPLSEIEKILSKIEKE